jgi:hypothetical protein
MLLSKKNTMKFNITVLFLLFFSFSVISQDIIYLKDGTNILVNVVSVDRKVVKYKKPSGKGPINEIAKSRIAKIQYESGAVDNFVVSKDSLSVNRTAIDETFFPNSYLNEFPVNILSINTLDFFAQRIGLAYERVYDDGNKSIRIPLTYSLSDTVSFNNTWSDNSLRTFEIGFDFLFYPTGQGRLKYAVGPMVRYANYTIFPEYADELIIDPVTGLGYIISTEIRPYRETNAFAFGINNYFVLMASNNIYLSGSTAIGVRKINNFPDKSRATRTLFNIGFHVGYRF